MATTPTATFEELHVGDVVLKRVTTDGSPSTFMVQFTWDLCAEHRVGQGHCGAENQGTTTKRQRLASQKSNRITKHKDKSTSTSRRARYTPADDATILRLKGQGLSWIEIAEQFPGRSAGAIQLRYYTKLKREEEWEVEAMCRHRTRDDGDLELLVRWTGGEETWEPYENMAENMAETQALDEYEHLHAHETCPGVGYAAKTPLPKQARLLSIPFRVGDGDPVDAATGTAKGASIHQSAKDCLEKQGRAGLLHPCSPE